MPGSLDSLYRIQPDAVRTRRVSSYDRSGGNGDNIHVEAGATAVLADIKGAGIIRHIWFTIASPDPMARRNIVLKMFWDGGSSPSVLSPVGDFFGQGWGECYNYVSLPLCASPGGGRGLNCYFPMPFHDGARVEIENQSDKPIDAFYYYIDYEAHPSLSADIGCFHALWRRELTEPHNDGVENEWAVFGPQALNPMIENNYVFADIEGKGQFVGVNYFVDCPTPIWYGEGDDMWMVDGERWPGSLHGTGTEDFFCSSWSPNETYNHPYFGYARVSNKYGWMGRTHCYRHFIEDPIYFSKSLHASIEHGHANCLTLDICTVAYWYQTGPGKPFAPLPPKEMRQNMPDLGVVEMHRWREAWRQAHGGGKLWGNEK